MESPTKQTLNLSRLDKFAHFLSRNGVIPDITLISRIRSRALDEKDIKLRKLVYKDYILLEKIVQYSDEYIDDVIFSYEFSTAKLPNNWDAIVIK